MAIRGIIFDMDGTIIDSAKAWRQAETQLFKTLGCEYDPAIAILYKGMSARDVGRVIHEQLKPREIGVADCGRIVRDGLIESSKRRAPAMPGADDLLRRIRGRYPAAVASGSPLEVIGNFINHYGWKEHFNVIVSSESVPRGKPAPDVFLLAAEHLGIKPADGLVIEDSLAGVQSARDAGMKCFVVPSYDDTRIREQADRVYSSLAHITLADIASM